MDPRTELVLSPQLDIHVLELRKLRPLRLAAADAALDAEARWLYFLKEGRRWATLPAALQSPEMQKAMSVLERFSDAKRDLALYQSRVDFLHVQRTLEVEKEEDAERLARLEAEKSRLEAEKSRLEAEKSQLEAEKSEAEEREAQADAALKQERAEKEQERAEKEQERAGRAQAEAKLERLRQVLLAAGIDPDPSSN